MGNEYSIEEKNSIGEGGFAKVYRAKKPGTDYLCAVKIFKFPVDTMSNDMLQGYEKEVNILK